MALVEIRIPQLGEGLQEARIVRFLKQPGDAVRSDEPIFEMETDKALMEIEAPCAGILGEWQAAEDDVLPIGAVIGSIASEGAAAPPAALPEKSPEPAGGAVPSSPPAAAEGLRNAVVPPRTRAYAREKGLTDGDIARLAERHVGKLMPADIDRFLAEQQTETPSAAAEVGYQDIAMPSRQRTLVYRLQTATQAVVPATLEMELPWAPVEQARAALKTRAAAGGTPDPSQFTLFAWCVAQAAKNHPRFRSTLLNESTLREHSHIHLGIAVARPGDELLLARVASADAYAFDDFVRACQEAVAKAREGQDQTSDVMQLSLTSLAAVGARKGIPVVAAPAVGTLFVGAPYDEAYPLEGGGVGFRRLATMVLTFDHRLLNGVGAAAFLNEVRDIVCGLPQMVQEL
jgi:pyruvate dehydrogenase E2 component (dihydrolipoamide acetyltransferase)